MADFDRLEALFADALGRPPADRPAFLDAACGADADLRRRLDGLLAAHAAAGGFLSAPHPTAFAPGGPGDPTRTFPAGDTTAPHTPTDVAGAVIAGRYKLLEQIGEGGMGTVWMAQQTEPVRRRVAVKLIRADRGNSKTILARFEAERQAIALMDHPHIAKLLDAGTVGPHPLSPSPAGGGGTGPGGPLAPPLPAGEGAGGWGLSGCPYFVMELVKGVPLTDYCDAHTLPVPDRLELFRQICSAVQHAHQKGVIHRDLKPTNILVESHDGKAVPKVIDFGLAKATGGLPLTDHTLFTGFGSIAGTPLYMAPEQAAFNAVDVDTRADVYALGVILYELLTGTTPIARETLKAAALEEVLRVVREQEPPSPSHRLSTADARPAIAAKRQTEPAKLGRMVKGELDWIVLKALSKDRDRRYETATGLARDVERFLNREPVAAGPPSAAYRARKFVARNRAAVTAAGLVLLALVAGVAGTTWQAVRAEVARAEAEQQRQNALAAAETERAAREAEADQRAVAQAKQAEAEDQRRRAEAGEKLAGDRLAQVEAERRKAAEEAGIARAVKDFLQNKLLAQTDTTVQADALVEAGGSASGATLNPTVRELLDRAARELTPDKTEASFPNQPRVQAEILHTVGDTYRRIGEYRPAIDLLKRSNALLRLHHGPDHPDTLASTSVLAHACQEAGRPDLALPLYEEALALTKARFGPDHLDTLTVTIGLARAYRDAGRHDRAVPLFERTLAVRKDRLGPDHPDTLSSMGHLGVAYHAAGEPDRALPLCREAYTRRKAQLGPDHPLTLASMADLAQAYLAAGRPDRAVPLYEAALALRKVKLGPDHPETLGTMNNLGAAYHAAGRPDRAVPLLEEGQVLRKAKLGPDHPSTLAAAGNLATAYWAGRRYDRSVPLLEDTLTRQEVKLGRDHPNTVTTAYNLGVNYRDAGRAAEAVPLLERVYALWARDPARRRTIGWDLYTAYARAGRPADAARVVGEVLAQERAGHEPGSPGLGGLLAAYGKILTDLDPAAAEPVLRECLELREKLNPTAWNTANAKSLLGGALVGLGRLAEAEPLLVAGYAGLLADRANIPPPAANNLPDAADRLVELYVALGKPDEAKRWRAERAKYPFVAPPPRPAK